MEGLTEARGKIERIDARLLTLLNLRARIVAGLHARKAEAGRPAYDALRTDQILDRLLRLNRGPLRDEQVLELFTFLLQHFALEHRPARGAQDAGAPVVIADPVRPDALEPLAQRMRRHGIRHLRVDAAAARRLDARHGLRLVVPAAAPAEVRAVADLADVVEAAGEPDAAMAAALAGCGRPVLLCGGTPAAVARLRDAGVRDVLASGSVGGEGTDFRGIAALAGVAGALADLRGLARSADLRRAALLGALAAGARGAIVALHVDEDDEALADLLYRSVRLCHALRAWPGAHRGGR